MAEFNSRGSVIEDCQRLSKLGYKDTDRVLIRRAILSWSVSTAVMVIRPALACCLIFNADQGSEPVSGPLIVMGYPSFAGCYAGIYFPGDGNERGCRKCAADEHAINGLNQHSRKG
ncbi:MAG: hypothetical protein OSB45_11950 [Pseudomonadales bacterium]|nr:hypothetical protein [Pseudomonadales bacterium]